MHNRALLDWITRVARHSEIVMSVCTGAFFLAQLGRLDGLRATTHHSAHDELAQNYPTVMVDRESRFVDHGPLLTAAGISAGIDASLHVVGRLFGTDVAQKTAARMEYPWKPLEGMGP
jgi:transcriptional regulator GlxA family with amidase domain